jgi:phenylacetate-CoA ligase
VKSLDNRNLEPVEQASRDQLVSLQLRRLTRSLHHTYNHVSSFRAKCDAAGVHPQDLRALSDLARFPFMTKEDFRNGYPFGLLAVPRNRVMRIHASSGTTGKPTLVAYTARDIDTWASLMARSLRAAGARKGDIVHVAYGYGLFTGGLGAHYGAERLGCTVLPMSGGGTERQVQFILDLKPDVIMVTPSYMLNIADEFLRRGRDPKESSLRIGVFGAEPWTETMRTQIEQRFGLDAVDIYGLSEVIGPGVAAECAESKDGPVLWEDHFYPEIINPDTGAVRADGEQGELVLTSLTKEALPVIRYRTRDVTKLLPPTSRSMRRLARITDRTDDMLILRGVNLYPSQVEELVLNHRRLGARFVLELRRNGSLDHLVVKVEPHLSVKDQPSLWPEAAQDLQQTIKSNIGVTVEVLVCELGTGEPSSGKQKRVLDLRNQSSETSKVRE